MTTFQDFAIQYNLPEKLAASLVRMNYVNPTPIQEQAIPLAMEGRDVLGSAATGTGKTAAFSIPMITRIMNNPRGSALVLTPTRELATQVMAVIRDLLGARSFIPTTLLIGGDPMGRQIQELRMRPRIIVGTPGRINDHLERGNLILHDANFLVLDETDRMLDMGFGIQIDRILKYLPAVRQTLMFSATIPPEIAKMSAKYLNNPARIAVGQSNATAPKVKQEVIQVAEGLKYDELVRQLDARGGSIILFVKTKRGADRMAEKLNRQKHSADALHGDLHQRKRERVIQSFRDQKFRILVATDIAARGLDIPHIEHVINYDLPQAPEDYIHRIGRTARNGAEGSAICLISPEDSLKWRDIHKLLFPNEPAPSVHPSALKGKSSGGYKGKSGGGNRFGKPSHRGQGGDKPAGGEKSNNRNRFRGGKRPGSAPRAVAAS